MWDDGIHLTQTRQKAVRRNAGALLFFAFKPAGKRFNSSLVWTPLLGIQPVKSAVKTWETLRPWEERPVVYGLLPMLHVILLPLLTQTSFTGRKDPAMRATHWSSPFKCLKRGISYLCVFDPWQLFPVCFSDSTGSSCRLPRAACRAPLPSSPGAPQPHIRRCLAGLRLKTPWRASTRCSQEWAAASGETDERWMH